MTKLSLQICTYPGCGKLIPHKGRCARHAKDERARADDRRGTAASRGYGYKWQRSRLIYLQAYPLCVLCQSEGLIVVATVVDHIQAHKGNQSLFWDVKNWQALCKRCHDRKTAIENGGFGNVAHQDDLNGL